MIHTINQIFTFFFFNDTATTEIYTLSLHDALPIYTQVHQIIGNIDKGSGIMDMARKGFVENGDDSLGYYARHCGHRPGRSEEHTSELQSQSNLVCRLLLEKKKKKHI